jgi:putative transposase
VVCVESLAVKNLLQHEHLAKAIADVGWGELLRMRSYKAAWYGQTVIPIDRVFPSSKRCSVCGYLCETLDLDERQWTCPQCGAVHDWDTNVAVNTHNTLIQESRASLMPVALLSMIRGERGAQWSLL